MNDQVMDRLLYLMNRDWGDAFAVYADLLRIALPVVFTFCACSLLVNLVLGAFTKGKIKWFGGGN